MQQQNQQNIPDLNRVRLYELTERQANIVNTILSFVGVNGKVTPLQTVVDVLNSLTNTGVPQDQIQAFGNIFGEVGVNNVNIPIKDVIGIVNAVQNPVDENYEKIPDLIKELGEEKEPEPKEELGKKTNPVEEAKK